MTDVRQVLGWRHCKRGNHWIPPELDGEEDHATRQLTTDDMLAYIEAQGCSWEAVPVGSTGTRRLIVSGPDVDSDGWARPRGRFDAPTLHAALSAAVLAVAEREEPGNE